MADEALDLPQHQSLPHPGGAAQYKRGRRLPGLELALREGAARKQRRIFKTVRGLGLEYLM